LSSVRIVFPKVKLAEQLRAPGGATVIEAMTQAADNLSVLRPDCLKELRAVAERIEQSFDRGLVDTDQPSAPEFYGLAASGVGLGTVAGLPAADQTLISLCRLTDYFEMHGRWDQEALRVHVQTLKLLVSGVDFPPAAMAELMAGLERVNQLYRPADESAPKAP
jgi:hypothetical protein